MNDKIKSNIDLYLKGKDYWTEYKLINGFAKKPDYLGMLNLSRDLDLDLKYLRPAISFYLENRFTSFRP